MVIVYYSLPSHGRSTVLEDGGLDPPRVRRAEATYQSYAVLPLLFEATLFNFALRIRAGAITLPFLLLHGALLIRPRLARIIWVESHKIRSPLC